MTLYLEGPMGSGKTRRLIHEASQLLETVPAASVLILCSNHARQKRFTEALLTRLKRPLEQLPVYTYAGYVRNNLFNYWPLVEARISKTVKSGKSVIMPQLSGMEDSEFILRKLLVEFRQKAPRAFAEFPGNDAGLLKQIIRRIRLRSENRLTRDEMVRRSELLEEICILETAELEKLFDQRCYALRVLDPSKQLDVFHGLLEAQPVFQAEFHGRIQHLIVDDVDETIPAQQRFIEFMAPKLENLILSADVDGGSRRGYLNAYPYDWAFLKSLKAGETVTLTRADAVYRDAQTLLSNWKKTDDFEPMADVLEVADPTLTQVEMLDKVADDLLAALQQGYTPGDFAIILPETSSLTFYQIKNRLSRLGIKIQLLCGTRRPLDNPLCRGLLYLLQLANSQQWQFRLSPLEFKTILTQLLQLHRWDRQAVDLLTQAVLLTTGNENPGHLPQLSQLSVTLCPEAAARYTALLDWLERAELMPFEKQIFSAFSEIVTPFAATDEDKFQDLNRWIQSYGRQKAIFEMMEEPQAGDSAPESFDRFWLSQVKTGSVADTPETPEAIDPQAVVVGSPQKVIDFELSRKIQFWLDVGSREWARSDNAPLYNAWVHSAVWDGSTAAFSEDFKEAIIRTRAAHITRTLMLLATETVRVYDSELDHEGFTQAGLLKSRLLALPSDETSTERPARAVLRPDQQPILDYRKGSMAITAVPGAGKTFINVELILELIERGAAPDSILVLTYMDSAAKTLLGRLKNKLPKECRKLPVVSTIHSLAFRILTENDHALALGFLPEDVEILDDHRREEVIQEVARLTQPEDVASSGQWYGVVDRCISHAKMHGLSAQALEAAMGRTPRNMHLRDFLPAYCVYQKTLHEQGQLDFNDLILKAVEVLETQPEVRAKYQAQFAYIIEDEAQDSSRMLQRLIHLIGGPTPNLIRTGDPNQSITTTFSSADPSVFRDFISGADTVVQMAQSGRCAPEVIALANRWITEAEKNPVLTGAFQPVEMTPVPGQNPTLHTPLSATRFEMERDEIRWIIDTIRRIKQEQPEATLAILLKENKDVLYVTGQLQENDIPAISLSETLNMHPVFSTILSTLQLLEAPGSTEAQIRLYDAMVEAGIAMDLPERRAYLSEHPLFYQSPAGIDDEFLLQTYYDLLDFSRDGAGSNVCRLIIRITDRMFLSVGDRSNGYLCALWAQEILDQHRTLDDLTPLEIVTRKFEAFQKSRRRKKGFSEALSDSPSQFVQVMTMHKSKGQEFDVVFMPRMTAQFFHNRLEDIKFKEQEKVIQELDRVLASGNLAPDYPEQAKRAILQEEARLIYVGLTRARRGLYLSAHTQGMIFNKLRPVDPAWGFTALESVLAETATNAIPEETAHA